MFVNQHQPHRTGTDLRRQELEPLANRSGSLSAGVETTAPKGSVTPGDRTAKVVIQAKTEGVILEIGAGRDRKGRRPVEKFLCGDRGGAKIEVLVFELAGPIRRESIFCARTSCVTATRETQIVRCSELKRVLLGNSVIEAAICIAARPINEEAIPRKPDATTDRSKPVELAIGRDGDRIWSRQIRSYGDGLIVADVRALDVGLDPKNEGTGLPVEANLAATKWAVRFERAKIAREERCTAKCLKHVDGLAAAKGSATIHSAIPSGPVVGRDRRR